MFALHWVNHLLFADDSLIFLGANLQSAQRLNEILQIYAECSRQAVNKTKSSIYFSPNASQPVRDIVKQELGIHSEAFTERYLGLPTAVGRIHSGSFDHIGERSRANMQGSSERLLACAGREILLKSVIQAIPTFSMTCFLLTKKICKQLTSAMEKYWWSSSIDRKSMHWISWKKLSVPKIQGGMGFRELENFNLALLGKHGWRLITHPNSLCSHVLKGKYFSDSDFMQANAAPSSSATWKAIIAGRSALQQGLIKRVVNGESISVWNDPWIPTSNTLKPMGRLGNDPIDRVAELIDNATGTWDLETVHRNFLAPDAEAILNIPIRQMVEKIFWHGPLNDPESIL